MKTKRVIPSLVLVALVVALGWLVLSRYDGSVQRNQWVDLVVAAPAVLAEAESVVDQARAQLPAEGGDSTPLTGQSLELSDLTEQTEQAAASFAQILVYLEEAAPVEQGPLEELIDPFSLGSGQSDVELVARVPDDFREQLAAYTELEKTLKRLMGETETLTEQLLATSEST